MGDTLAEYEEEFNSLVVEIGNSIRELTKNKKGYDRSKVDLIQNRIKRARDVKNSYRVEFRSLPKTDHLPFQTKTNEMEEQIKKLENDLNWSEKQSENGGNGTPQGESTMQKEYQDTMSLATKIQKEDISRTENALKQVIDTNNIGTQILEEMKVQDEQLTRIDKGLNEVDSNLKLAQRQIRVFARKMATDKLILGLILLIVIAIVITIIFSIVKPTKSNPDVRDRIVGSNG
ncbi:hypothetical protein DLAC_03637 [Tieghemostelium lacteum]|uniref:t-SNARE coiled-coil homology domain-containing protein n=1 Tax=Tieghemostelium lacteum TaxID=361077 RepID=A0A152A0C9_TIELA|nr:hypothetical protein DLAC_03637 [Tieghemostelium lacteum]|eukprot:KYQ99697.1 hypothetical protein DLAC_03637 [Tieghemostelium lacteum]